MGNGNLKPFRPGQSGNPKGRPKGSKTGLRARLQRVLDKQANADILQILQAKGIELEGKDNAEVIAHVLNREAQKGNIQAIKMIAEQTESPLPKDVNIGGELKITLNDCLREMDERQGENYNEVEKVQD